MNGAYAALLTPLHADGSLATEGIAGHVERLLAGGVDGVLAMGTTGEFADLTAAEREEVIAATVTAVDGRVPVLAGVGAVGTTEACAHARAAAGAGADAVVALPPLYWKLGDRGLVRHFAAVSDATGLPLLLYDFPSLAGTALSPDLVARVAQEVPRAAGVKLSGRELATAHGIIDRTAAEAAEFSVMVGAADLAFPALVAGADGTITALANVAPRALSELHAAVRAGDLSAAARHHAGIRRLLAIPAASSPPVLALKAAARAVGSPIQPVVRTPPDDPETAIDTATQRARRLVA